MILKNRKKILLTGVTGFVGQEVIKYLINKNYNIYIVVRNKSKLSKEIKKKCIKIYETKNFFLESKSWYKKICKDIDIIINLAWYVNNKDYLTSIKNFLFHLLS